MAKTPLPEGRGVADTDGELGRGGALCPEDPAAAPDDDFRVSYRHSDWICPHTLHPSLTRV